jgi:hypothetical protein
MTDIKAGDISIWFWLILPVLIVLFVVVLSNQYSYDLVNLLINSENGVIELGTVLIVIIGAVFGFLALRSRKLLPNSYCVIWVLLNTLACVYIAGEELSWGQHLTGWKTPEVLSEINDQNETNLHNISSWFDQKPRLLLEIWVLIGGVFAPIYIKLRGISLGNSDWQFWLWPPLIIVPTALLTILVESPKKLNDIIDFTVIFKQTVRFSEVQEFYFAWFLMLYLLITYKRLEYLKSKK